MRHAILLVPTSSAATSAERFGRSGFIFGARPNWRRAHAGPPAFFFGFSLIASIRACAAASDNRTVTRSGSLRSIMVISRVSRGFSASSATNRLDAQPRHRFGQPHLHAVFQSQVPAPLADEYGGPHLIPQSPGGDRAGQELLRLRSRHRHRPPAEAEADAAPHRARAPFRHRQ